jgi:RND family efflux transporter MFP subunit
MRNHWTHNIALACAVTAALLMAACDKKDSSGGTPVAAESIAVETAVETATVQPSNQVQTISAIGTMRHTREIPVSFTVSGRVTSVRYNAGDYVREGGTLASVATQSTQMVSGGGGGGAPDADNAAAFNRLAKMDALYRDGWVTKKQFEAAQAKADTARSRASAPVAIVRRGSDALTSPVSGAVLARLIEAGQGVGPGSPAYILGQDSLGFTFRAPVTAADAAKLKTGMRADINIEAIKGPPLQATISEIEGPGKAIGANTAANTSANIPVMVIFRLPAQKGLKSAQIGTVSIPIASASQGFLQIPASALFGLNDTSASVFVVNPVTRRAEIRAVTIDQFSGGYAIVSGGVVAGEVVVTGGKEKLRTGARVSVKR